MRLLRLSAATVILSLFCMQISAETPLLWGRLEAGPYPVGLNQKIYYDLSRDIKQNSKEPQGRSIEITLWYPAIGVDHQQRLSFRDYLRFLPEFKERATDEAMREWLGIGITGEANGLARPISERILNAPMSAHREAPPRPGPFPLVLWTMRHDTQVAQSVLCEFLASHGYVVASARFAGPALPAPWEMAGSDEKLATYNTHLQDLNFAFELLMENAQINPNRVGILTWSYAAELAPRIQMQHANVRVVLGLSSNPLSPFGLYQGAAVANLLDPKQLGASYVVMTETLGFNGQKRTPPAILNQLPEPSFHLGFGDLAHGNFNALEGMIPGIFGITNVQSWSKGGALGQLGYETISQYTLWFLDKFLKPAKHSNSEERAWETHLAEGFVTFTRYKPSP